MNYEEAVFYLESCTSFGIKPGLERITALLERLGNPQQAYKIVHVAGTNGKGSVTTYLAYGLSVSGIRVGVFTSPHLQQYTERISVNHRDILPDAFARLIRIVKEEAAAMVAEGIEHPTTFELLTAAAFLFFKEQGVSYAVVEVGMGGLLDSTNVVTPEVSVITNVSLDHQAYCGDTLEEIATHKAGIIKKGIPVVTAAQGGALKVIREKAHQLKCRLYTFGKDFTINSRTAMKTGQMITVESVDKSKSMLFTKMAGIHQAVNLACAYMALQLLMKDVAEVTEETVREGLARAYWQGRFDIKQVQNRTFILDGAHNENGAESFALTYKELFKDAPKTIIFSALQDKDAEGMIHHLVKEEDKVIVVPAPTPRSRSTEELAKLMPGENVVQVPSVGAAIEKALELTEAGGIIVVCGSLYILGDAMSSMVDMQS